MIDFDALHKAIDLLSSSWLPWLVVIPGLLIGLIFGAIPGLNIPVAMAVFLPITAHMDFLSAVLFLTAIFTGGGFGGAIPAILMNIPGTGSAVATAFDGYPMAQQGKHSQALGIGLAASTIGVGFGYLVLMLFVSPMAEAVLNLGPFEMFMVATWGLTLIAVLGSKSFSKGLLAGLVGVLISTIGMGAQGDERGTFGSVHLLDGIPAVPALIGLFAASELFRLLGQDYIVSDETKRRISFRDILTGAKQTLSYPMTLFRGSVIGVVIGAIPGVGSSVSNLVSYASEKRRAKDSSQFGHGDPRGVAAAESANSSSEGGSMATLLALGIPGGSATAVMLGAFAMHNITGGSRFMTENMDIVYSIILGNFAQTILLFVVGIGFVFVSSSIVRVPLKYLVPTVFALAILGAFSLTGNMVGPITVFVFAVIGWFMRRFDYPVAAMVIGLLLGRMAEGELLRSYQLSGGSLAYLLDRPIALVIMALLILSLVYPLIKKAFNHS